MVNFISSLNTPGEIAAVVGIGSTVITILVQAIPWIHKYPITWVGRQLNKDMNTRMDCFERQLSNLDAKIDINRINSLRDRIMDFANACKNGRRHSENDFETIFDLMGEYHDLIKRHELRNDKFKAEQEYIERLYQKLSDENGFLKVDLK